MLPTFLVIGAMKAGTTSLYYYLAEHPDIGMSVQKETDFFLDAHGTWQRGTDWYAARFPDAPARGECAPNYTKRHLFGGVPARIQSVCPDATLIYLVRDPIERAVSHYVGSRMQGREERPFAEAVRDAESNYVLTSRYHWQLAPYLDRFPRAQMHTIATEALRDNPQAVLRSIYRTLGVDPSFENRRIETRFNAAATKKKRPGWLRWLSRQIPQPAKDWLRPRLPMQWLPGTPVERPTLAPAVRAHLADRLRPDADALRDLTGQPFDAWSV